MNRKLFILGWDNALAADVVKTKIHPAYMAALSATAPVFAKRWTFKDSVRMQGQSPFLIWEHFEELLGREKAGLAKEVFYKTYQSMPGTTLVDNAERLLRHLHHIGGYVVVVSNKNQRILEQEAKICGVNTLVDDFIGMTEDLYAKQEKSDADCRLQSRTVLLKEALASYPNAPEALVVAAKGYAVAAHALELVFEEASSPVFDWLCEREKALAVPPYYDFRDDLL